MQAVRWWFPLVVIAVGVYWLGDYSPTDSAAPSEQVDLTFLLTSAAWGRPAPR